MSNEKTHWRKLHNPDYFGAYAIPPGKDLIVEIERIEVRMIKNDKGNDEHTVAILKGQKPWILNATNQKMLTKVIGSPYVQDWENQKVKVYTTMIRAFGEDVEAVRVRPEKPNIKLPALTPESKKWDQAAKLIAQKKQTVESLREFYDISEEHAKQLEDAATSV